MHKAIYHFIILLTFPIWLSNATAQPEVTTALVEVLSEKTEDEFISLNIRLAAQYDQDALYRNSRKQPTRELRRNYVINELKTFAQQHQAELLAYLHNQQKAGQVADIRPLWISNFINVQAKPSVVSQLMANKDLARLDHDVERQVLIAKPENSTDAVIQADKLKNSNIAWNVTLMNVPDVWEQDYTGENVVVAILDTGVNYNHQDLQNNMWTHPDYPYHGFNFAGNNFNTMDYNGHGTHCAGTVAGNGIAGTITGMAPNARIMVLKSLSDTGSSSESAVWSSIEFAVEYGAHIMSLSLGWKHTWNPDRSNWRTVMNNALNAGVIAAVAAGNEGNSWSDNPPSELRTPGDVPPPWLHPDQTLTGGISAVVSVGSTTITDNLSGFSSKGPVTWQNVTPYNDYAHNPGMGLIRPDVVAPGSDILSLTHNHNASYTVKSGTSMAAPAVAGVMALLLSKNPELTPEEIAQILEETAIPLAENKNNLTGSGRIDALEAINETPFSGIVYTEIEIDDSEGNNDGNINPGEYIRLHVTFINPEENPAENVTAILSTNSPYITITDTIADLGTIQAVDTIRFEDLFSFVVSDTIPGNHQFLLIFTTYRNEEPQERWYSHYNTLAHAPDIIMDSYLVLDEEYGNNNGLLDPGETATLRFIIINNGQLESDDMQVKLEALHPFIQLVNTQVELTSIAPHAQTYADFTVIVNERINPGIVTEFNQTILAGAYTINNHITQKVGIIGEDWQTENFERYDWEFAGHSEWTIDDQNSVQGTYSARSGDITHNQKTELILEYEVFATDSISFYRKVSSENSYDWLEFYIDDERVGRWSGDRNWERFVFPVEAGTRTFRWVYEKDASVSTGNDAGWIDFIELPSKAETAVFAGFDTETCNNVPIELEGFALRYNLLQWSTRGDGVIETTTDLAGWYYPGPQDIENGFVNITLQAQYQDEDPVTDEMEITFLGTPEVNLGSDTIVCRNHTVLLDAGEGDFTYEWFDGSIDQTFLLEPDNYTQDEIEIWVVATHENGCVDSDTIMVTFDACTDVADIQLNKQVSIYPNPTRDVVYLSFYNEDSDRAVVTLIGTSGQTLKTWNAPSQAGDTRMELDVSDMNQGVYFIRIENGHETLNKKLVIQ